MRVFLAISVSFTFLSLQAAVNFKSQIKPIIDRSCIDCHNDQAKHPQNKKPKGGLRLDTPEMIMKGGANGVIIVPKEPSKSSFYTLTILPEDHEDVMPSKGDILKKSETGLIKKWIEEGADFGVKLKAIPKPVSRGAVVNKYDVVGKKVKPASPALIKYFDSRSFFVKPVKEGNPLLKVDFLAKSDLKDEDFKKLSGLSNQLISLNLARTNVQDKHLNSLSGMKRLVMLQLDRTKITDKSLSALGRITSLEYLNLYDTKVSDRGIENLKKLKNLKKIYLWKTKVTAKGASSLKRAIPGVVVNLGE